ncbi:MAG TPA: hypothetical protein VH764_03525 [Gemmatimonadales bacterium]|jgi:hypothetical protein
MMNRGFLGRMISAGAMLLAGSACAYGGATAGLTPDRMAPGSVQVQVSNSSGGPLDVYATGSGMSYRVGTVHPGISELFMVRPGMTLNSSVEFVAQSADGRMVRSGPMLLRPGDVVDFDLTPYTATSNATVRSWRR